MIRTLRTFSALGACALCVGATTPVATGQWGESADRGLAILTAKALAVPLEGTQAIDDANPAMLWCDLRALDQHRRSPTTPQDHPASDEHPTPPMPVGQQDRPARL